MQFVICVIIDRKTESLLLTKENSHQTYWFLFDKIKPNETRNFAAKRLANQVRFFKRKPLFPIVFFRFLRLFRLISIHLLF